MYPVEKLLLAKDHLVIQIPNSFMHTHKFILEVIITSEVCEHNNKHISFSPGHGVKGKDLTQQDTCVVKVKDCRCARLLHFQAMFYFQTQTCQTGLNSYEK